MGIINNKQLVKYARGQLGRMYVYGCYGQKGCETVYISKLNQYPAQVGKWPKSTYVKGYGQKWHDCAGLVKGAIFCKGVIDAAPVYSWKYDYSADGIIELCAKEGKVWTVDQMPKNITGLVMWKPGHMGIWDAETQTVIEAKGHMYGVCETTDTPWKKAGQLPASWVDYIIDPEPQPDPEPKGDKCNVELPVLRKGIKDEKDAVKSLQILLNGKGYRDSEGLPLSIDGSFGSKTDYAVKSFQKKVYPKCGEADGVVGTLTWTHLIDG